jgi:hypothetical protein
MPPLWRHLDQPGEAADRPGNCHKLDSGGTSFIAQTRVYSGMTKLLDHAMHAVRNLPAAEQNDIARIILQLAGSDDTAPPVSLSPEQRAAIATSKAAAANGEFATDEQVRAVWAKHSL